MKRMATICAPAIVLFVCVTSLAFGVDWVEPADYTVAGVIGASYENGQAPATFPVAPNSWYWGGSYKTWVDFISGMQSRHFHWLNYARAGDVSMNGAGYLNEMLQDTTFMFDGGEPQTSLEILIIGFWGNDFMWFPGFNQEIMDGLIANVQEQIAIAKAAGVDTIIVLGWPDFDDFDLDSFIAMFPDDLPYHIDESGYYQSKDYFYQALAQPNPDYLFVDPWCARYQTFDGVHPAESTSRRAAAKVHTALLFYNNLVGRTSVTCR